MTAEIDLFETASNIAKELLELGLFHPVNSNKIISSFPLMMIFS